MPSKHLSFAIFTLLLALTSFAAPRAQARESAHLCQLSAAPAGTLSARDALTALQEFNGAHEDSPLTQQNYFAQDPNEFESASAVASGFNVVQALRVALGDSLMKVPTTTTNLETGHLGNLQFAQLVRSLLDLVPSGTKSRIWIDENANAPAPESAPARVLWRKWLKFDPELLKGRHGEFKVVVYTSGRSRHFVVLKDGLSNGTISVVDPASPRKTSSFTLSEQLEDGTKPVLRLQSDDPTNQRVLTLDTIFTIAI